MSTATILIGDALIRLRELPSESVQCCVTSPPYFGLRDYQMDGQIGLEGSPAEYVEALTSVFEEVRRVLTRNGTLWLNLGDSYASAPSWGRGGGSKLQGRKHDAVQVEAGKHEADYGVPRKNLLGIPWRVAFALQDAGWILRQDIIWAKTNAMPESVTDRCTKSHEYLFLLAKSPRYRFNAAAISEPSRNLGATAIRFGGGKYGDSVDPMHATKSGNTYTDNGTRNRRSVWTISTTPFSGAHFAVMPEALVEPCVLAGSEPGDLVLDPFAGSGTVGLVALKHGRDFLGIELNPEYAVMAENRIYDAGILFDSIADDKEEVV